MKDSFMLAINTASGGAPASHLHFNQMKGVERIVYGPTTKLPLSSVDQIDEAIDRVADATQSLLDRHEGELLLVTGRDEVAQPPDDMDRFLAKYGDEVRDFISGKPYEEEVCLILMAAEAGLISRTHPSDDFAYLLQHVLQAKWASVFASQGRVIHDQGVFARMQMVRTGVLDIIGAPLDIAAFQQQEKQKMEGFIRGFPEAYFFLRRQLMVTNCDEGNLKKAIDFLFEQTNMYDITAGRYFALRYLPADDPRDIIFRHPVAQRLAVELFIERQGLDYSICLNTDNGTADPYMTAVTASLMRTHMQLPPQYSRPVSAREGEL